MDKAIISTGMEVSGNPPFSPILSSNITDVMYVVVIAYCRYPDIADVYTYAYRVAPTFTEKGRATTTTAIGEPRARKKS